MHHNVNHMLSIFSSYYVSMCKNSVYVCMRWVNSFIVFSVILKLMVFFFFQRNHMCISMELVTAVLGDHGQRPREDYGELISLVFFLFFELQLRGN